MSIILMIQGKWKCECFRKDKYAKYNSSTLTNTSKNTLTNTPKYKRIVISYRGSGYPGTWTACYAVESGRGSRWKIWKDKKVSSTNQKQVNTTCKQLNMFRIVLMVMNGDTSWKALFTKTKIHMYYIQIVKSLLQIWGIQK